jgi:hypothetical protein
MIINTKAATRSIVIPENAPEFWNPGVTARVLDISPVSLSRYRMLGTGPRYHKVGRKVLYLKADVIAYVNACVRGGGSVARQS